MSGSWAIIPLFQNECSSKRVRFSKENLPEEDFKKLEEETEMFEIKESSHLPNFIYQKLKELDFVLYENIQQWGVHKLQNCDFIDEICGEYRSSIANFT